MPDQTHVICIKIFGGDFGKDKNLRAISSAEYWDARMKDICELQALVDGQTLLTCKVEAGRMVGGDNGHAAALVMTAASKDVRIVVEDVDLYMEPISRLLNIRLDHVWCLIQGARGAWPNLPDGYTPSALAKRLLIKDQDPLHIMHALYQAEANTLPAHEHQLLVATQRMRNLHLEVTETARQKSLAGLHRIRSDTTRSMIDLHGNEVSARILPAGIKINEAEAQIHLQVMVRIRPSHSRHGKLGAGDRIMSC